MADKGLLKYAANTVSSLAYKTRTEPEFVSFLGGLHERGKLLDIGCGIGLESDYAHGLGFEVTGIDKDYGCIKKARNLNPNVNFKQTDFFNFMRDVPQNEFNIIVDSKFSNRLSLGQLRRYYKNISKILRYGGYMYLQILSTDDMYCRQHCPQRKWTKIDDVYIRFFTKKELLRLLGLTGLKVESFRTVTQKNICNDNQCRDETYHIVIARQIVKKW